MTAKPSVGLIVHLNGSRSRLRLVRTPYALARVQNVPHFWLVRPAGKVLRILLAG